MEQACQQASTAHLHLHLAQRGPEALQAAGILVQQLLTEGLQLLAGLVLLGHRRSLLLRQPLLQLANLPVPLSNACLQLLEGGLRQVPHLLHGCGVG